ncbi:MAG: hypothetical protein IJM90_01790 [Firmicutes bacterium]|nr:hypothetical protein [Bacillota bacterium]
MLDFMEELKKFKPSPETGNAGPELSGRVMPDLQQLLMMLQKNQETKPASEQFDQLGLEDVQ